MRIWALAAVVAAVAAGGYWVGKQQPLRQLEKPAASQATMDDPEMREMFGPQSDDCSVDCRGAVRKVAAAYLKELAPNAKVRAISTLLIQDNTWLASVDVGTARPFEYLIRWYVAEAAGDGSADYWRVDPVDKNLVGLALTGREPEKAHWQDMIDDREPYSP